VDKNALLNTIKEKLPDYLFVVVSNREPFIHVYREGKIVCLKPASGLVSALEPVMEATRGIWVAYGSGNADKKMVDEKSRLMVPPIPPGEGEGRRQDQYTLKRVWLTKEDEAGYYYGFANEALWPLSHLVYMRPAFRQSDWECYQRVNKLFAQAILEEIGQSRAFVFIQDYHFAPLAKYLKQARHDIICALFWHIPWPNPEAFRICPWKREILEGLLANDLLGFHLTSHCDNFIDTVDREIEARIDREKRSVIRGRHETLIRSFPISVDFDEISRTSTSPFVRRAMSRLKKQFPIDVDFVLLGLDRLDYTKGIPEKFLAFDRFLEKYPQYRERCVLFQNGALSRIHLKQYKQINDEVDALADDINWKHSTNSWSPIILTKKDMTRVECTALFRLADVCIIGSLHDGMNLVSKEFVASRNDRDGVLVLSRFTGAARELEQAILINPYDREDFADKIKEALEIPKIERKRRMRALRETVWENNIYKWASDIILELSGLVRP